MILECCHSGAYITSNGAETGEADPNDFNRAIINAFAGYTCSVTDPDSGKSGELMRNKFIVLTACTMEQESWNWWYDQESSYADQSFGTFTYTLLEGLGCAWSSGTYSGRTPCDTNQDSVASLGECSAYVSSHATQKNLEMGGSNVQECMSYGPAGYSLFIMR